MEDVTGRRVTRLDHVVVVPVTVDADVLLRVIEQRQRGARRLLVLVFVSSTGLSARTFPRLDLSESRHPTPLPPERAALEVRRLVTLSLSWLRGYTGRRLAQTFLALRLA